MNTPRLKQLALKPQDLLVILKVAVNRQQNFTFAELGRELSMSASEAHAASQRATASRLLLNQDDALYPARGALMEFLVHGVKYAFPPVFGPVTRGMVTGIGAHPLVELFAQSNDLVPVWPDSDGHDRGLSLIPLYPSVPAAARADSRLYEVLILIDALRGGAAREREIAETELSLRL